MCKAQGAPSLSLSHCYFLAEIPNGFISAEVTVLLLNLQTPSGAQVFVVSL